VPAERVQADPDNGDLAHKLPPAGWNA
jgi:hypothetical protein